jgi:hypothetical protein
MFAKLVPETPIKDLIFDVASSQSGSFRNLVSEWPHHRLLDIFREFLDATALATVPLVCLKAVSADSEGVPTRDALLFLQMSVFIRDVTMMAATLHNELFVGLDAAGRVPHDRLIVQAPYLASAFGEALGELDKYLSSTAFVAFEQQGWHMPTPIVSVRAWQQSMVAMNGKCRDMILEDWSCELGMASAVCKAACPSWDVCFLGSSFNEMRAVGLLKGKLNAVVKAHNKLHGLLLQINAAAKVMDVLPRLQVNDLTSESVVVALHNLSVAKDTSVLIAGVELMNNYKNDHLAGVHAAVFLKDHPGNARGNVPAGFWSALEVLVADGQVAHDAGRVKVEIKPNADVAGLAAAASPITTVEKGSGSGGAKHVPIKKEEQASDRPRGRPRYRRIP